MQHKSSIAVLFALSLHPLVVGADDATVVGSRETVAHQLRSIPALGTADETLESYQLTGHLPWPVSPRHPLIAHVAWSRQHGSAMVLMTQKETPFLWAAGGQALICDYTTGRMTLVKEIEPQVTFRNVDGELKYEYGLGRRVNGHAIDLESIATGFEEPWVLRSGGRLNTLSAVSATGRSRIELTLRREHPTRFEGFRMIANDDAGTLLCSVDSIQLNQPLPRAFTSVPIEQLSAEGITIAVEEVKPSDVRKLSKMIARALHLQPLVEDPQLRRLVPAGVRLSSVDWKESEERFKSLGPKLRTAFQQVNGVDVASPNLDDSTRAAGELGAENQ